MILFFWYKIKLFLYVKDYLYMYKRQTDNKLCPMSNNEKKIRAQYNIILFVNVKTEG